MDTHPRHLPADERRAVTVESVVALAGSQNPSEITTAAIAKHMNLTQGALFRHFPNKEAIWQAVMEWVAERLLARIDRSAQGIESPSLDNEAAATLFIGTIQGLVMQSLLAGDVGRMHRDAPRVFAIYRRGIRSAQ